MLTFKGQPFFVICFRMKDALQDGYVRSPHEGNVFSLVTGHVQKHVISKIFLADFMREQGGFWIHRDGSNASKKRLRMAGRMKIVPEPGARGVGVCSCMSLDYFIPASEMRDKDEIEFNFKILVINSLYP